MKDVQKLVQFQILGTILFIITKAIRPSILKGNTPEFIKTTFLSLPNFFEGFIGLITLTGLSLYINHKWIKKQKRLDDVTLYWSASIFSTVYVITQELKIHNLGGNNVYDLNDVYFSIIGLATACIVIFKIRPTIKASNDD